MSTKPILSCLQIKKHRPTVNIILNGTNIEQVLHTKFLGVIIDENLTWREQIKTVETKVSKSIGVLYKRKDFLDIQALRTLYQSLVEPYMSYCCEIWGNTYPSRLRKLSLLQKKKLYEKYIVLLPWPYICIFSLLNNS